MKRERFPQPAGTASDWRDSFVLVAAMALLVACSGCHAKQGSATAPPATPGPAQHVNATEAQKLVAEKNVQVLDVRTPAEFASGHIPGALNINFRAADFEQKISGLDKTAPYLVHCASGNRSGQSLPLFEKEGFQHLYHLDGGLHAWENAGLTIEK